MPVWYTALQKRRDSFTKGGCGGWWVGWGGVINHTIQLCDKYRYKGLNVELVDLHNTIQYNYHTPWAIYHGVNNSSCCCRKNTPEIIALQQ